jgi:hypothetical protein
MTLSRCHDFASTRRFVERQKLYLHLEENLAKLKLGKGARVSGLSYSHV